MQARIEEIAATPRPCTSAPAAVGLEELSMGMSGD